MSDVFARPRIGVVLPAEPDALLFAVAARALTLAVMRVVPRARVAVLVAAGPAPAASGLDCGRAARRFVDDDVQRFDALLVCGEDVPAVAAADACAVVPVPGGVREVAAVALRVMGDELRRNRVETLRLLGWTPGEALPPRVGVDELIAGVGAGAVDARGSASFAAIARGIGASSTAAATATGATQGGDAGAPGNSTTSTRRDGPAAAGSSDAILAAVDEAARLAIACWRDRGSPGAIPDPAPARRAGTQHAALRVALRKLERDVEAAERRAKESDETARLITGSRTWRYTERLRDVYHGARRRLKP